jgi:thiaminase
MGGFAQQLMKTTGRRQQRHTIGILDAEGRARVLATFRRAIDLEKVFFDAAYG